MERIKTQANKLWQILVNPSTTETYKQTLLITWTIIKETAQLLLFILFLTVVLAEWFYKKSVQAGRSTRIWLDTLQNRTQTQEASDPSTFFRETGKSLLAVGQSGVTLALNTAKAQLGMEIPPPPPATETQAITPNVSSSGAASAPTPPTPPAAGPAQTPIAPAEPVAPPENTATESTEIDPTGAAETTDQPDRPTE